MYMYMQCHLCFNIIIMLLEEDTSIRYRKMLREFTDFINLTAKVNVTCNAHAHVHGIFGKVVVEICVTYMCN